MSDEPTITGDTSVEFGDRPEEPAEPTAEEVNRDLVAELGQPEGLSGAYITPGREGIRDVPRRLLVLVELPDRRNLEWQARNLLRESDIREAMAKGARALHDAYMQRNYNALGFTFDPEAIEYDYVRLQKGMDLGADTQEKHTEGLARTLICTVVIRRG